MQTEIPGFEQTEPNANSFINSGGLQFNQKGSGDLNAKTAISAELERTIKPQNLPKYLLEIGIFRCGLVN